MEQVKKGYKKTEVGIIPEDWSYDVFGKIISDYGYGPRFSSNDYSEIGNVKTIRGTDISQSGEILYEQVPIAKLPIAMVNQHKLLDGDLVVITTAECGLTGVFVDKGFPYIPSAYAVRITLNSNSYPQYFKFFFQTNLALKQVDLFIRKATVANLPASDILKFKIPLPPTLTEQKAIADALSDVDELIASLEKLIAKKKDIKQGAMQALLTPPHKGGKRLDGFSGEWKEVKLGDCLKYEQPTKYLVNSTEYEGKSQTPVLTAGKSFLLGYTDEDFGIYENLPVIIFDDFTTSNQFVNFKFKVKSSAMKMLTPISNAIDITFIYALMQTIKYSLGDEHKRRWIAEFSKIKVCIPEIAEQKAISRILNDLDDEITTIGKSLNKQKAIKQGMMQELLTGKTRLV